MTFYKISMHVTNNYRFTVAHTKKIKMSTHRFAFKSLKRLICDIQDQLTFDRQGYSSHTVVERTCRRSCRCMYKGHTLLHELRGKMVFRYYSGGRLNMADNIMHVQVNAYSLCAVFVQYEGLLI